MIFLEYYPNPECFDPERFSEENIRMRPQFTFIPFGKSPKKTNFHIKNLIHVLITCR
jgi:hypothetical protein